MIKIWVLILAFLTEHLIVLAQIPPLNTNGAYLSPRIYTSIPIGNPFESDLVSNGYGHNYVTRGNDGSLYYYLVDNSGGIVRQATLGQYVRYPSIVASRETLHISFQNTNTQQLELWRSTDAGISWAFAAFRSTSNSVGGIDSWQDDLGVHIVVSSSSMISYHLRLRTELWAPFATNVYPNPTTGSIPSVFATADSAHVLSSEGFFSFKLPTSGSGDNWIHKHYPAEGKATALIALAGNPLVQNVYVITNSGIFKRTRRPYVGSSQWTGAATLTNGNALGKAVGVVAYGYPTFMYNDGSSVSGGPIWYLRFSGTEQEINTSINQTSNPDRPGKGPAVSANEQGVAFIWQDYTSGNAVFRRKPYGMSGVLKGNQAFTDTNWITGNTTVEPQKTLWLRPGSITYLLSGSQLHLGAGASLICETGSQVVVDGNAEIYVDQGGSVTVAGYMQANANARFKFGQNAGLVINGKLTVAGSQTQPVTFDRVSPSVTSWGGIVVDNKSSGATINYANIANCGSGVALSTRTDAWLSVTNCVIDNAAIGLEIVPPQSPGPPNPPVPTMIVTNNAFSNIGTTGISVDGLSTLVLQGNTITQPPPSPVEVPTYGVRLTNASPQMLNNTINGFYNGLYCADASSPVLENELLGGYNVMTECEIGVECADSDPVLGLIRGGPMNDDGGQNSIFGNSALDVSLWGKSFVLGENNWYGEDRDPPGVFYVDDNAYLDYEPWLPENPNLDGPGGNGGGERQSGVDLVLLKQVLSERAAGNDREAIRLLRSIIADEEQDSSIKEWAIRQIVAIAQTRNQTGLSQYLRNLITTSSGLARQIKSVLPAIYATERSTSNMLAAYDVNIQEYPNTHLERSGLYGKLVHAIYTANDYNAASQLFTQLEAGYPGSAEVVIGRVQLENFQSRLQAGAAGNRSNGGLAKPGEETSLTTTAPMTYRLSESYPNPFNPSTTLSFDLPEPSIVSLVVFDVLGRKIAELANGYREAGYHSATWNATEQASGVYFARFTVTGSSGEARYSKVNKLVLMK